MQETVSAICARLKQVDRAEFQALMPLLEADDRAGVIRAVKQTARRLEKEEAEAFRIQTLYDNQRSFAPCEYCLGLDEVGRGPVAGPLTVAGVVLPAHPTISSLNDSKQIPESKREALAAEIKERALAYAIVSIEPAEIDELGMAASLRKAFAQVIVQIDNQYPGVQAVLLDGNALHLDPREKNLVKGDANYACIAAASIIAKVHRDSYMVEQAKCYPAYHFNENKGYASANHIQAIKDFGLSKLHRESFCRAWTQKSLF